MIEQQVRKVAVPGMLRVGEAARMLHVHPNTLRKWSSAGLIPSYRIGSRQDRRFLVQDLVKFLEDSTVEMI